MNAKALCAVAVLGVAVFAALPRAGNTSSAAFPGTNGLIAFQSFRDGVSQIYVMTDAPTQPTKVPRQRSASCYALPTWSPNGKLIAFEFNPNKAGRPASRSDIYVMNADGSSARNVTKTRRPSFDGDPAWSNDNRTIVFESQRDGNSEIYNVDVRTRKVVRLTRSRAADEDPTFSPDGKRIAFTSSRDGNPEIYVMDARGRSPRNITRNSGADRNPTWSPTGSLLAFDSDRDRNLEIYTTDERFLSRRLTTDPGLDALPAWAPDGTRIVFVSDRAERGNRDLWVMRSDGRSQRKLTQSPAWDTAPDWGTRPLGAVGNPPSGLPPDPPLGSLTSAIACVAR